MLALHSDQRHTLERGPYSSSFSIAADLSQQVGNDVAFVKDLRD